MEPAGVCDTISVPGELSCLLTNPLAPGANATIFLTATAATAGLITTNQAVVVSATTDPNFLDNIATEETMVLAQAACAAPTVSGPTVYPGGAQGFFPTAGDVNDHDGADDLILAGGSASDVILLRSNGAGAFLAPVPIPINTVTGSLSATLADLNNDQKLDLIVTDSPTRTVAVALGNATGNFFHSFTSAPLTNQPGRIQTGDFNEDGNVDLLIQHSPNVVMLLGTGLGSFGAPITTSIPGSSAVFVGHFSPDSHLDVLAGTTAAAISSSSPETDRAASRLGFRSPPAPPRASPPSATSMATGARMPCSPTNWCWGMSPSYSETRPAS